MFAVNVNTTQNKIPIFLQKKIGISLIIIAKKAYYKELDSSRTNEYCPQIYSSLSSYSLKAYSD